MRGVGHGGKQDKILAVSPHHFEKCSVCGSSFGEGEAPRFREGTLLPAHSHCLNSMDRNV